MHSYALIHTMETFALGYTHPTPGRHKPYPKGGNTLWQRKNATWQSVESTVAVPPPPKSTLNCLIGTCLTKCSSSIPCWVLSIASIRINPWIQLNWRPKLKCWRQHFSRCNLWYKAQEPGGRMWHRHLHHHHDHHNSLSRCLNMNPYIHPCRRSCLYPTCWWYCQLWQAMGNMGMQLLPAFAGLSRDDDSKIAKESYQMQIWCSHQEAKLVWCSCQTWLCISEATANAVRQGSSCTWW